MLRTTSGALFLFFGLALSAAEPEIYFSFDRSSRADFGGAAGSKEEIAGTVGERGVEGKVIRGTDKTSDAMLSDGLSGKALQLGNSRDKKAVQTVEYVPFAPLSAKEGCISFWIRPNDWDGKDHQNFHHFFGAMNGAERLVVYKFRDNSKLVFLLGSLAKNGVTTSIGADISGWEKNSWHHVCAVWNAKFMELYVDGKKMAESPRKTPPGPDFTKFQLGEYWHGNPGSSSLDELRIYGKSLSAQDVLKDFLLHASKAVSNSAPVSMGVGIGKPTVNGMVEPGEYALSVSGMNSSMNANVQYSPKQSLCRFAWDEENLYVAFQSPVSGGLKTSHSVRDANLWEDDAVEVFFSGFDGKKDLYQFIFNSGKGIYDSRNRKSDWQSSGVRFESGVKDGLWTFECAIPWKNFNFVPADGKNFRMNLCRDFVRSNEWTCLAPGDYFAVPSYAKVTLLKQAPSLELPPLGELYGGKIQSRLSLAGTGTDTVKAKLSVKAPIFPFTFEKEYRLEAGKSAVTPIAGRVPESGNLEISVDSEKCGILYRNTISYRTLLPVRLACIYTDIPEQSLVMEVENTRLLTGKNKLHLILEDVKTGKNAFESTQVIPDDQPKTPVRFSIRPLPEGEYTLRYAFLSPDGRELFKDYEAYAKYPEVRPWTHCSCGLTDVVPPPWSAPKSTDDSFECWGRKIQLGGKGLIRSMISQDRELLSAPVSLKWNGKVLNFCATVQKKGVGFTDFKLVPEDRGIPLEITVHAEFDGLLWFTLSLLPDARGKLDSLSLEVPLNRANVTGFDDCSSIMEKKDLANAPNSSFFVNPAEKPFFWCGGDDVGLMGGSASRRGWHLRDKAKGLTVSVQDKTVVLDLALVDSPLNLADRRSLEFYLQPTPVRPRNTEMQKYRIGRNMICWGEYVTLFFAHKRPGKFSERHLTYFREQQEKKGMRVFYYNAPKGASPVSPEWNYFGKEWHCSPPRLGEYMRDAQTPNRAARNMYLSTYGCLNSQDFFDFKLDSIGGFIRNPEYKVKDLYFDLTWPRPCSNPVHGCLWTDEFGYRHQDNDLKSLRLLMKRLYITLKEKTPDGLFRGHILSARVPSDVFFDSLVVGELYDRHIVNGSNYYGVLTPSLMRIAYASRDNEMDVDFIPQFERALQLFAPEKFAVMNPEETELDRAICHYLGYMLVHDLGTCPTPKNARMKEFFETRDRIAVNGKWTFHPYWKPESSPVRPSFAKNHVMASAFSNPGKVSIAVLNDSDETERLSLIVDTRRLGLEDNRMGKELIAGKDIRLVNGKIESEIGPRALRIFVFD